MAHFSLSVAGACLGLVNAAGIAGRICWGIISDTLFKGNRLTVLIVIAFISGLCALIFSRYDNAEVVTGKWFLILIIFMIGFTSWGWNGIYHAYLVEKAGLELTGTVTGISLSIVFCGNITGPLIFGRIVDLTGGSYGYAWGCMTVLMALSIVLMFVLKE
jgi:sugar phosphate permease